MNMISYPKNRREKLSLDLPELELLKLALQNLDHDIPNKTVLLNLERKIERCIQALQPEV